MQIKYITVTKHHHGQRIDNFLLNLFRKTPKSRVYRAIRSAEVRVNKHRVKALYRLSEGEVIRCPELDTHARSVAVDSSSLQDYAKRLLQDRIIFEDEQLLVLNKPSGVAVHGGSQQAFGIIQLVRAIHPNSSYLELVHRLDKDTSGCLLIAKQRQVLLRLQRAWAHQQVNKMYFALLVGELDQDEYRVAKPLRVSSSNHQRIKTMVAADGKHSVTCFTVLQRLPGLTYVAAYPLTGRTHQIRVHAAALGCPILGDDRYGDRMMNARYKQRYAGSLCLHAAAIELAAMDDLTLRGICVPLTESWHNLLEVKTAAG